jgi:hypothetical protein
LHGARFFAAGFLAFGAGFLAAIILIAHPPDNKIKIHEKWFFTDPCPAYLGML